MIELREILEGLYYAPKMDNLNPVGWKNVHINTAMKEVNQWAISKRPKKAKFEKSIEFPVSAYRNGYNVALGDYIKNLEEK